jgi:5-methylcytosine-specific restriction endonuclease McrA
MSWTKEKQNECMKNWRTANKLAIQAYNIEYYKNEANKERKRRRDMQRYQTNKEILSSKKKEYYKQNKERISKQRRVYRQTEHGKAIRANIETKREAIKLNQLGPNPPTAQQRKDLLSKPCWYCGNKSEHIDHFYPLSTGGFHDISNLVPACFNCNVSKGNKNPYVFCIELLDKWLLNNINEVIKNG